EFNITAHGKVKESHFNEMEDITVYDTETTTQIHFFIYNEYNEKINYGIVKSYLDDKYVDEIQVNSYSNNLNFDVKKLNYGNHTIRLLFEDENGETPSCETTFTLTKIESEINIHLANLTTAYIYINDYSYEIWWCVYDEENDFVEEGIINVYIDGEYFSDIYPWDEAIIPNDYLSMGNHEITLVYHFENELHSPIETTFTLIKSDLIRPTINNIVYQKLISIIEDETINYEYEVVDTYNNYKKVITGTVTLYIINKSDQFIPLKTVNATDIITINISELKSSFENNGYPKYITYYLEYNGDNITYAPSNNAFQQCLINIKKSFVIYEKFRECEEGTKIYFKTVDSNNTKITNGYETVTFELCDDMYNQIYEKTESIAASEEYLLLPGLNLTEYLGFPYKLDITYTDTTYEYYESNYYMYYGIIKRELSLNIPDHIYTQIGTDAYCPFNFTDNDDNLIDLKEDGFFMVDYLDDGTWYSFQNLDYDNPIIETTNYPFTECGDYPLRIRFSIYGTDIYEVINNNKVITLTIEPEDTPQTNISINEITLKAGTTATLTATVTDQHGNNINGGKVVFKVNGKTLKDSNGKVIYAKVTNGIATVEYEVPENLALKEINITATYSGSSKYNKETTSITTTVGKQEATITITPFEEEITANSTITLKAKVICAGEAITQGKVIFKINGKTIKDTSGKVIYADVDSNGEVSVDYNIGNLKAKTYTLSAIFTSSTYERVEDDTTITVV
ncbi:MAG: Ig-like domain-containing protein, partial [Methanosphaera sp.]|nr:Ig-like domain-containing protein [Methanosphaera sp.]